MSDRLEVLVYRRLINVEFGCNFRNDLLTRLTPEYEAFPNAGPSSTV
ncbi:hypothetical protein [Natronorubrum sp. FCH18a]